MALEALGDLCEGSQHYSSYKTAIDELLKNVDRFTLGVVSWTLEAVDDNFVSILEAHDPLALLIVTHYAVLLHYLDERWWARGTGKSLVDGLTTILLGKELPFKLRESAEWARAQVGLETEPAAAVV